MFQLRSLPNQGYTLIEMAATLVVAGIIMTVGIVAVAPAVGHAKVRSAANVVAGDLQYAQVLAVRGRRPISVVVDPTGMQLVIQDRDISPQGTLKVYRIRALGPGTSFSLDQLSMTGGYVNLFPNGVAGSTITVTLGLHGFERRVRLTRAGQIRIIRTP